MKILSLNQNGSGRLVDAQLLISRIGFSHLTEHKITNRGKNLQKKKQKNEIAKILSLKILNIMFFYTNVPSIETAIKEIFVLRASYCPELRH